MQIYIYTHKESNFVVHFTDVFMKQTNFLVPDLFVNQKGKESAQDIKKKNYPHKLLKKINTHVQIKKT